MKTANDLKKGQRVLLTIGWEAVLLDNKKGNIRFANVFGLYEEMGSIYAHDIKAYLDNGQWMPVKLDDKQKKMKNTMDLLFG